MINPLTILIRGVFLITVVGPSLAMGLFETSSMAAGAAVVSLLYVCIVIAWVSSGWLHKRLAAWVISVFFGTAILYLHGAYSFFSFNEFDFARFWQSHFLLILYLLGAYCFMIIVQSMSTVQADGAVKFLFWVLILSAIAGLVRWSPFFPEAAFKSVLFYGEPSHFALDFLPVLMFMVVRSRLPMKITLLLGTLSLCLMLENLTLLIGIAVIIGITARLGLSMSLILLLSLISLALPVEQLEYYIERLNFSGNSSNLSVLVYMQGMERAFLNLMETSGLGVGFQQFGIVGSMGDVQETIKALIGQEANLLDGGSIAQKIIGEFGILGVLCLLWYFWYFVRSAKWLFRESQSLGVPGDPRDIFFHSSFVMYSIDLVVRGVGYFSASGFLFVASVCWLFFKPRGLSRHFPETVSSQAVSSGV